jgi:hypothetical protein
MATDSEQQRLFGTRPARATLVPFDPGMASGHHFAEGR